MATEQKSGLVDLEKELTCSICTEVLYQPLTLLKCLHTFCGSCLKEWFSWQAGLTNPADPDHPYTCPSCRATVYETKPNAGVTTLLDIFTQANPGKGKSKDDKADIAKRYKPGDEVLPKVERRPVTREEEEDRRQLQQVMGLSLQEVGISDESSRLQIPESGARPSSSSRIRERRSRSRGEDNAASRTRRRDNSSRRETPANTWQASPPSRGRDRPTVDTTLRQIEHQSSLRSLLSASDIESSSMEEEIMRQIMEEGFLDGIDLNNIDVSQEDELSEKIANAYRQRQRQQRMQSRSARHSDAGPRQAAQAQAAQAVPETVEPPRTRRHSRSHSTSLQLSTRQSSSGQPSQADNSLLSPTYKPQRTSNDIPRPDASPRRKIRRASIDIATVERPAPDRSAASSNQFRPPPTISGTSRSTTDPESTRTTRPHSKTSAAVTTSSQVTSSPPNRSPRFDTFSNRKARPTPAAKSGPLASSSAPRARQPLFVEANVECYRCGKKHIEYQRHFNCLKCNNGTLSLCLPCYRDGKGCLCWYGFGRASWRNYERKAQAGATSSELPHTLASRRYTPPTQSLIPNPNSTGTVKLQMTSEDPAKRLESGFFCDNCYQSANSCYWKCDICNEGEWGFCNNCVDKGNCCTHPLLPLTQIPSAFPISPQSSSAPLQPKPLFSTLPLPPSASLFRSTSALDLGPLKPLIFNTPCTVCKIPIPPTSPRHHCPQCSSTRTPGAHQICTSCYANAFSSGQYPARDGPQGWHRCLTGGHGMVLVSFDDRDGGLYRAVVRDLVGGVSLPQGQDSSTSTSIPPDGGVGLAGYARWAYFPAEGVTDELMFPKHAEIREIQMVNEEWYYGVFAGQKGLFPASRVVLTR